MIAFILMAAGSAGAANTTSLQLNGTSQYVSISDTAQSGLDITSGTMVIEAYIKLSQLPSVNGKMFHIFNKKGAFQLFINPSDNKIYFISTSDGTYSASSQIQVCTSSSFNYTNTWKHLAVIVKISQKTVTFLIDGKQVESTSVLSNASSIVNSNGSVFIGANGDGDYFMGLIDDVRIWNVERTTSDIADNLNKELTGSETGLVTNWKFNVLLSGIGTYSNTLTNNGGAIFSADIPSTTVTETVTPVTETPVVTPSASNPITTVINQGVAVGLSIGTNQQYLVIGKDAGSVYYLAIAETTGTFLKSITLTTGYVPISVTQVYANGTASTTQVSVLATKTSDAKFYNLLVNTSTGAINPVAW